MTNTNDNTIDDGGEEECCSSESSSLEQDEWDINIVNYHNNFEFANPNRISVQRDSSSCRSD